MVIVESSWERAGLSQEDGVRSDDISNASITNLINGTNLFHRVDKSCSISPHVTDHSSATSRSLVRSDDAVRVLQSQGNGLLDEHVLVGLQRKQCLGCMEGVMACYQYQVDFGRVAKFFEVSCGLGLRVASELLQAVFHRILRDVVEVRDLEQVG